MDTKKNRPKAVSKSYMTNEQAKQFAKEVFSSIKDAKTIDDLENIISSSEPLQKNSINTEDYPKIEFEIKPEEIMKLIHSGIIDDKYNFSKDITHKFHDTIAKILYAAAWKRGELKKMKHIIKGIVDAQNDDDKKEDALVYYQFGKYLTKIHGQPIIDQHVIRAFAINNTEKIAEVEFYRKLDNLNKDHKKLISKYKDWLKSSNDINEKIRSEKDYSYYIDKILFATGKAIKFRKHKEGITVLN